ncbi:MAG: hypothetical protein IJ631_02485, partial [Schwartzia sp.]|nr:hypothetical protein [Schwartzia sp. (in: firmicutes)]
MRYGKWMAAALLATALLQPLSSAEAKSRCTCEDNGGTCNCEKTLEQVAEEWSNRCRCSEPVDLEYTRTSASSAATVSDTENSDASEEEELPRFIEILRDESFIYYMDRKTARYLNIPHMAKEKMIDVWIKLEPLEYLEGDYTYPSKYYLEHYLIRPKRQQIQFLAEMEVKGRPSAEVENRRYDGRYWEDLVPGSIEDLIYHAVLAHKSYIYDESS